MKLIAEITDKEILGTEGLSSAEPRYTARAIVKNEDLYAVIHSEKFHPYSLPGGGIDDGEDIVTALKREILEETGCTCGRITELGMVKENRAQADYTQISYYYVVEADSVGEPHFTKEETNSGTVLQWHTLFEMIKLINELQPSTYQQQYLKARDIAALNEYITDYIFVGTEPCKADTIFVVGGSLPEAAELAAELYNNDYADKIIIGGKYSVKRDCFPLPEYETEYDFYKDILLKNGVNENDIYGENESGYTKQNAEYAKRVVEENNLSIIKAMIVCKSFHAKRCLLFYQMYFPTVIFTVVTFDGFGISRDNWQQTEYGRERIMGEIQRIEEQTREHYADLKWVFFDIGSTLVDEIECYEIRFKETTENTDISFYEFKDKVVEFAATSDNPYKEAVKFFGLQKTKWYKELETPYPFTESVLSELSKKYKLGIIANQSSGSEQRLADWGIGKYFDLVIASAEEGVEKPNPEIFRIALDRANCLPKNAVMVGDRLDNDIIPAKELGMKTVWVKQSFATYQPNSNIADYIINTLDEILKIL